MSEVHRLIANLRAAQVARDDALRSGDEVAYLQAGYAVDASRILLQRHMWGPENWDLRPEIVTED